MVLFWQNFSRDRGALLGLGIFLMFVLLAIFAPWVAPYDPDQQFRDFFLTPPIWIEGGQSQFILGTDAVGRDILSRIIYGTRYSLLSGFSVTMLTMFFGILMGLAAGYYGGLIDYVFSRMTDTLRSIPYLLLALGLVAIIGPGFFNAILAISLTYTPVFYRITRAQVINEAVKDYITASRMAGAGPWRLMLTAILPNCMPPLIVQATLFFSNALLDVAALGFLGLGAQPPTPEWGTMLADAREFVGSAWWVVTFPGLAMLLAVLAINMAGDGLRDALDPKLQRL